MGPEPPALPDSASGGAAAASAARAGAPGGSLPRPRPRWGLLLPPVSELDRADASASSGRLMRQVWGWSWGQPGWETGFRPSQPARAHEWRMGVGFLLETGPELRREKGFRVSAGRWLAVGAQSARTEGLADGTVGLVCGVQ